MFKKESVPFAPTLIESMRSLGYSFEAAIADIVDNSISANAKNIKIYIYPSINPKLIIWDDGCGMTSDQLEEAMRYGSKNPLENRAENDLGRFGLGLKSASLSQCRKLLVISKKNKKISAYSWDLDYIIHEKSWMLIGYNDEEIKKTEYINLFSDIKSGTCVILENFDRISESTHDLEKTLRKYMNNTIEHLSLVFHRYLDDSINIYVNNEKIESKDPFLRYHKKTQPKRWQTFKIHEKEIKVKPYILPHVSNLTGEDIKKVGSKERLKNEQGFYIYRNKRLIIWGTWFRLERKDELSKLARIMVDIPNSLDYMWNIDIKKSSANLPDIIKTNLYNCVYESVLSSEKVHTYKGRREYEKKEIHYVWERIKNRDGYEYRINRNIPQIKMLENTLDSNQLKLLENMVTHLENTFPISTMYLDVSKGRINEAVDEKNTLHLYDEVMEQIEFAKKLKLDYVMMIKSFMKTEPYCEDKELIELLKQEL